MNNLFEREDIFKDEVFNCIEYDIKMLNDFFDYWSEPNKKGKMKWELEKTWDTKRRLKRWFNNQKQWHGEKLGTSEARIAALKNW